MRTKISCLVILFCSFYSYAGSSELERSVQAQSELLTEYQQRISELESNVDELRGQLDSVTYQLNQVIENQKVIFQQMDSKTEPNSNNTSNSNTSSNSASLADWTASGDDKKDYNYIIKFVLEGTQTQNAISAFQQFLKDYPKSRYCANVNYWLGQLNYNQGKKEDASFYFATVVKDYPKSAKAGDSLYKVGLILLEKNEKDKAKAVFQQVVKQYSGNASAVELANSQLAKLG